jgi:TIR domain-containing protein
MVKIFISHTHEDKPVADAIHDLITKVFESEAVVRYSTARPEEGGIPAGTEWLPWIFERIRESQITVLILTPHSIDKPWLLWEAGAVSGAAIASGDGASIIPALYRMAQGIVPDPLRSRMAIDGEQEIQRLLSEVNRRATNKHRDDVFGLLCDKYIPPYRDAVACALQATSSVEEESGPQPFRLAEWGQLMAYPLSVVKIAWKGMTHAEDGKYADDDLKELPWVFDGNRELIDLYQVAAQERETPSQTFSRLHLTFNELIGQLKSWMTDDDLQKFLNDQERLRQLLIFQDLDAKRFLTAEDREPVTTECPIVFRDSHPTRHPAHCGKVFLPCLLAKRHDGPFPRHPHDTYLLVAYVDVTKIRGLAGPVS